MKKLFTIMAVLLFMTSSVLNAQTDSTTAFKQLDITKDQLLKQKENLKAGKERFLQMRDSIKNLKGTLSDELIEMQIDALEKGIDGIEDSIDKIEDDIERLEKNRSRHYNYEFPRYDFEITTKNRDFESHTTGIFFGVNGLINPDRSSGAADFLALNESRSLCLDIYFAGHDVPFSNNAGMSFGCDLEFNHYSLSEPVDLKVRDKQITYEKAAFDYKRQNLRLMYLSFPLLFEIQIPGKTCDKFYINAGVKGGIRVGSRVKQVYEVDGDKKKNRVRNNFETQLFRYSLVGGLGFGGIQVFGEYSPLQLFKDEHGPELYPFAIGVKFNF
jgi:hypothetical protein